MKIVEQSFKIERLDDSCLNDIEIAGRTAYKSEDKITNASSHAFSMMLRDKNHGAVLEFADMTVRFITDRGISHEIVRHRMCSFVQESTRYCDYSNDKFNKQITFIRPTWISQEQIEEAKLTDWHFDYKKMSRAQRWYKACLLSEELYLSSVAEDALERDIAQQARQVLNNSVKTEIMVKANFREWQHIFKLRAISKAAHPQMRALMIPLYSKMREQVPEIFDLGDVE